MTDNAELKKILESEEAKELIGSMIEAEVSGLKNKRDELLGSLKKEKETKQELEQKLSKIDDARAAAEEEALNKTGDIEKITELLKDKHRKELQAKDEALSIANTQLNKHVIGQGLTQALIKANVKPELMDAAKALIQTSYKGEVSDNDGTPFAKFDGQAVNDFISGWSSSETGKHFVSASVNSGSGANGANGKAQGDADKVMSRSDFENLSPAEKRDFSIEGGSLED